MTSGNYANAADHVVIANLTNSTSIQCSNETSTGSFTSDFSPVSCTDGVTNEHISEANEFFDQQECKRNKCNCRTGFYNSGWQCVTVNIAKQVTYTISKPITAILIVDPNTDQDDFKEVYKTKLESSIKSEMTGNKLVVGTSTDMEFSTFEVMSTIEKSTEQVDRLRRLDTFNDVLEAGSGDALVDEDFKVIADSESTLNEDAEVEDELADEDVGSGVDTSSFESTFDENVEVQNQLVSSDGESGTENGVSDSDGAQIKTAQEDNKRMVLDLYFKLVYRYSCKTDSCDTRAEEVASPTENAEQLKADLVKAGDVTNGVLENQLDNLIESTLLFPDIDFVTGADALAKLNAEILEKLTEDASEELITILVDEAAALSAEKAVANIGSSGSNENVVDVNELSVEEQREIDGEIEALQELLNQADSFSQADDDDDNDGFEDSDTVELEEPEKKDTKDKADEPDQEEQVLVNFASLTPAELEKTFGSFKPINALNPYIVKADPCRTITLSVDLGVPGFPDPIEMLFIKHDYLFMVNEFNPTVDCVAGLEEKCLSLTVITKDASMTKEMQIQVTRGGVYINLQLNRKRWDAYLAGDYQNSTLYPSFTRWAEKPKSQFQLYLTLKKYTNESQDEITSRSALVNVIVPRSLECDLTSNSTSSTNIKNYYREIFVQPNPSYWGEQALGVGYFEEISLCHDDKKMCYQCKQKATCELSEVCQNDKRKPPLFECDFKPIMHEVLVRVLSIIDAVQLVEVNKIRRLKKESCPGVERHVDLYSKLENQLLTGDDFKSVLGERGLSNNCYMIEYAVQVRINEKLVNGETILESLDRATKLILNELKFIAKEVPSERSVYSKTKRIAHRNITLNSQQWASIDTIIDEVQLRKVQREGAKLPGRNSIIYAGLMLAVFTLSYK